MDSGTTFYYDMTDGSLYRKRSDWPPEIWRYWDGTWASYPDVSLFNDVHRIDEAKAQEVAGEGVDLLAPGER